ncbi:MAG TPA: hypothetical protein VF411_04840 [Bacteroidia bacterium]
MKLSQKLADFHAEIAVSVPYIVENAPRLQVSTGINSTATTIQNGETDYNLKYDKYINPATHTEQSIIDINTSYDTFHPIMQALKQTLKHNKAITLTGADFTAIHIHQDAAHRVHIPAPTISPINTVTVNKHLVVYFFSHAPASTGGVTERSLPTDVGKLGRKVAIVANGAAAPADKDYVHINDTGATHYHLVFDPTQVDMKGYLITWYKSPTGEAGPASLPLEFPIN